MIALDEYKSLDIRIYNQTLRDKDLMRIVVIGVLNKNKREDETINNIKIPKSYISAEEIIKLLLTEYSGKCIDKCNVYAHGAINVVGKRNMLEVIEWINSLELIYKMAGGNDGNNKVR